MGDLSHKSWAILQFHLFVVRGSRVSLNHFVSQGRPRREILLWGNKFPLTLTKWHHITEFGAAVGGWGTVPAGWVGAHRTPPEREMNPIQGGSMGCSDYCLDLAGQAEPITGPRTTHQCTLCTSSSGIKLLGGSPHTLEISTDV